MQNTRRPFNAANNKQGVPGTVKALIVKRRKFLIVIAAFCLLGATLLARSMAATNPNLKGDLNGDNKVNVSDLSILLTNFNKVTTTADLNGDGQVTVADLSILLTNFNKTYTPPTGGGTPPTPPTTTPPTPPSGGVTPGTNDPTAATCPSPTPVAPITGYKIAKCEDFNNGLGAFTGYQGGGDSTVVGAGRKTSMCTNSGGLLILSQSSDGSTCGGSTNFGQRYGYWEVRMRITSGSGSGSAPHPVLILWPDSDVWADGELDYFETDIGGPAGGFLHCTGGNIASNCFTLPSKNIDLTKFHTFGFEWTASGATGYIDGDKWYTTNDSSWQPKGSMHQTIQLDNLSGRTPVKPGTMEVDWLHMYSK